MCNIVIPHQNLRNNPGVCKLLLSILGPHKQKKIKKREKNENEKNEKTNVGRKENILVRRIYQNA